MIVPLNFSSVSILTALCPLISLFLCITISILFHFDTSTSTHCKVINFLPSLSASFGSENPEKIIWNLGIAYHLGPRVYVGYLYKRFYKICQKRINFEEKGRNFKFIGLICTINTWLYYIELTSLALLTYISSSDNHRVHAIAFTSFIFSSILHMKVSCYIHNYFQTYLSSINKKHIKSLRIKKQLANINIVCFLLAIYFYYRHNAYCEPYVYTAFAFNEYIVVVTNILYHATAIYDFDEYQIVFLPSHDLPILK